MSGGEKRARSVEIVVDGSHGHALARRVLSVCLTAGALMMAIGLLSRDTARCQDHHLRGCEYSRHDRMLVVGGASLLTAARLVRRIVS